MNSLPCIQTVVHANALQNAVKLIQEDHSWFVKNCLLEVLFQTNHNCQLFAFVAYQLLLPRRRAKDAEAAALQQLSEWGFGEEAAQRALLADRAEGGAQEGPGSDQAFCSRWFAGF